MRWGQGLRCSRVEIVIVMIDIPNDLRIRCVRRVRRRWPCRAQRAERRLAMMGSGRRSGCELPVLEPAVVILSLHQRLWLLRVVMLVVEQWLIPEREDGIRRCGVLRLRGRNGWIRRPVMGDCKCLRV